MNKLTYALLFIVLVSCTFRSKEWQDTAQDFHAMPQRLRPTAFWFWNDIRVEPAELIRQIADCRKAGYGGICIVPYGESFEPKYLSDAYFEMYRLCVEEAQKQDMTLILYDEYGWPSGSAGGTADNGDRIARFKQKYPAYANRCLTKTEYKPKQGALFETALPQGQLMAAVAMDSVTHERIDLNDNIVAGKLKWQAPGSGHWKVMLFMCVDGGNSLVDYMNPEAVELFIGMIHDEYYKRLGGYFGKTIVGTFYDEIAVRHTSGGRAWTPEFNKKFEAAYGFSPVLLYPALWYDIGPETAQARNYLFAFRTELYAAGYAKLVSDWSIRHGVFGTGHQDNEEVINCVGTTGDLMKCFK